jgi:hypothetical protein
MNESDRNCNEQNAEGMQKFSDSPTFAKTVHQIASAGPTTKAARYLTRGTKKGYKKGDRKGDVPDPSL